jgi:hypothetical protein
MLNTVMGVLVCAWAPSSTVPCTELRSLPRSFHVSLTEVSDARRKAERLALLAQRAALEAEQAELQAQQLRLENPVTEVPSTSAPVAADVIVDNEPMALRSPLRWIGGVYPAVALSFPMLSSPAQKARQLRGEATVIGVTLDFIVDTAANANTISAQVAGPTVQGGLELQQVGSLSGVVGAAGAFGGTSPTYSLGVAELADLPKEERIPFISGLTASALPIAAPAAAGLLGVSFLNSFPGGVEFVWGSGGVPPSITFFGDSAGTAASRAELSAVKVTSLAGSCLPTVPLRINGVVVNALLDTGSPITVLNKAAATLVSLEEGSGAAETSNPLASFAAGVKSRVKSAQAVARGDVLTVGGLNGPVQLTRTQSAVAMSLGDSASFGNDLRPYVGDLPGLALLDGLGASAGPAVVLGTDVLRRRPRMIYTAHEVFV